MNKFDFTWVKPCICFSFKLHTTTLLSSAHIKCIKMLNAWINTVFVSLNMWSHVVLFSFFYLHMWQQFRINVTWTAAREVDPRSRGKASVCSQHNCNRDFTVKKTTKTPRSVGPSWYEPCWSVGRARGSHDVSVFRLKLWGGYLQQRQENKQHSSAFWDCRWESGFLLVMIFWRSEVSTATETRVWHTWCWSVTYGTRTRCLQLQISSCFVLYF